MKVLAYGESTDSDTLNMLNINLIACYNSKCIYCGNKMHSEIIPDIWKHNPKDYIEAYYKCIDIKWMHLEAGIPLKHLKLENGDPVIDVFCTSITCKCCGWWILGKRVLLASGSTQLWELILSTCGVLKNLDLSDLSIPVEEIKKYIAAKYDSRFLVNPRKFENVVASVFKNLGYITKTTEYSSDGGIDVILCKTDNSLVGVQVKRSKNSIKVEQIRSFIGALVLNNYTDGIYVTTSDFQSGVSKATKKLSHKYSIKLLNAQKFYNVLKKSQAYSFSRYPFDYLSKVPKLHPVTSLHLNSL